MNNLKIDARMALANYESSYAAFGAEASFTMKQVHAVREYINTLEAALRPFAELGEVWLPEDDKDDSIWVTCPDDTPVNNLTHFGLNFGHFRAAARAALAEKEER